MLNLDKLAHIEPYSKEWFNNRIAMITSSEFSLLCSYQDKPNELPKGAITYLDRLYCERVTGKTNKKNISTEAIVHGVENEPIGALYYFKKCENTEDAFVKLNKSQILVNKYEASTPDLLIYRLNSAGYNKENRTLDCETWEIKCPFEYSVFRSYSKLKSPSDLKSLNSNYYWQKIHQMISANVRFGNWVTFHPDFIGKDETKMKPMYVIKFDAMQLREDIKFAKLRTQLAIQYLEN